ncbi:hypothetical protein EZV62_001992 [Acer yangbiense]|uniref:DUF659 domain-containing protein n=1 Tax=Acer yangbiense TaxID=1000413 RepID=A0A5C7IVY4_9ROSI|nr:hypothetical protein EZV62_001992 [Acer yangbiense]
MSRNVAKCLRSTKEDQDRCKKAIDDARNKKKTKHKEEQEIRVEVDIIGIEEEEEIEGLGSRKKLNFLGPMDKFASKINHESSMSASKSLHQQNINDALFKQRTYSMYRYVARLVYETGISLNDIQNNSFRALMKAVGRFGSGYKEPSRYQLNEPLLKEEESFDEAHTKELVFNYVDKCIEQVEPQNVVQVVIDNASNNMATAKMLKEKRPSIFWSSCATHTINFMHEATGADGMTQLQRSARVQKPHRTLEEEFGSEDELVEDDFEFESDEEQVLKTYGEEQEELDIYFRI